MKATFRYDDGNSFVIGLVPTMTLNDVLNIARTSQDLMGSVKFTSRLDGMYQYIRVWNNKAEVNVIIEMENEV